MSNPLQALLDKAIAAIPAKHPVRAEIAEALAKRAEATERANRAWVTMRANREAATAALQPQPTGKGKAPALKAPAKTGPAPKATATPPVGKRDVATPPLAKVLPKGTPKRPTRAAA
jgi:hypothetical protein